MGAVTSQCIVERTEDDKMHSIESLSHGEGLPPVWDATNAPTRKYKGGCGKLECDVDEELFMASVMREDALNDKECADVILVQAVMRGELMDMKRALSKGASVDTVAEIALNMGIRDAKRIKRVTPLMRACDCGRDEAVSYLLMVRADPLKQDSRKWNALCYALGAGELSAARTLLEETASTARQQKVVAWSHKELLLEMCEDSAGDEVAAELQKEFGPGGFVEEGA